ncbi:hypothetical protein ACFL6X_06540 [Candidatus Latescibacterota bacterium]
MGRRATSSIAPGPGVTDDVWSRAPALGEVLRQLGQHKAGIAADPVNEERRLLREYQSRHHKGVKSMLQALAGEL